MRNSLRASPTSAFTALPGGCDPDANSRNPQLLRYLIRSGNRITRRLAIKNLRKLVNAGSEVANG